MASADFELSTELGEKRAKLLMEWFPTLDEEDQVKLLKKVAMTSVIPKVWSRIRNFLSQAIKMKKAEGGDAMVQTVRNGTTAQPFNCNVCYDSFKKVS